MNYASFEELEATGGTRKPFFCINLSSEDTVLNWLKDEFQTLRNNNETRLNKVKNNYLRYKGYQYLNSVYYPRDVLETQRKYTPQMVLPLISDAVDEKVARLMEFKPNVVVVPTHDETQDKNDAKVAKRFLDYIDYNQKLDSKFRQILTASKISGESFAWIRWNPDLGEPLKEVSILNKADSSDQNPNPTELIRQGDVEILRKTSDQLFYQATESWDKVDYCFVIEIDYVEALKLDYPEKADSIKEDADLRVFNYDKFDEETMHGMCRKIHFYHRKTKYLPQGYEACFTASALLKSGPLSYNHGELPIERLIDIENSHEVAGQSFIDKVKTISSQVNNSLNSVVKMMMLAGYAKWFVEGGSVDDQSLNNDISIVKIKQGAKPPVLAQANPVGANQWQFIEKLQEWFYTFSKSNSIVRGEPPPGVTAYVAMQYLSESESRRMSTDVQQLNQFVRGVYAKCLKTAGQFYKPDENRTMMIMGKDNRWDIFPLDVNSLTKSYSVMIQNTSGLSDSKSARTQQLIDLNAAFPDSLPKDQVLEMIGLAQSEKFIDIGSAAARAAEDENEYIMDGKGQIEPSEGEDLLTHYRIHVQAIQPIGFKMKAPPEVQDAMKLHIAATEYMLMDKAVVNPALAQQLAALPYFPMFAELPPVPPAPMPMPMPMEGQPVEGEPLGPLTEGQMMPGDEMTIA